MSPLIALPPALIAMGLIVAVRRRWIPGVFSRALAEVAALLAIIISLALVIRLPGG